MLPKYTIETYSCAECLHGYCSGQNMTVFAHSITLAASFDAPLIRAVIISAAKRVERSKPAGRFTAHATHLLPTQVGGKIGEEARATRNAFEQQQQFPNKTATPNGLACFSPQVGNCLLTRLYAVLNTDVSQINIARDPRWGRAQE